MKAWAAIFLLSLMSIGMQAQINEDDLIGTWFPVMELEREGYAVPFITSPNLLVFKGQGKGMAEFPGENTREYPFSYKMFTDSIYVKTPYAEFGFAASKPDQDQLILTFDDEKDLHFIRLPQYDTGKPLNQLIEVLVGEAWDFAFPTGAQDERYFIKHEFSPLKDTSKIHLTPRNIVYSSALSYDHYTMEPTFWSVSQYGKTLVLNIQSGHPYDWHHTFLIRSFNEDVILADYWTEGLKYEMTIKKSQAQKPGKVARVVKLLTRIKWRFKSEKLPVPNNILDLTSPDWTGDYLEMFPPYNNDSTLLIKQSDLDQKLLILEFNEDKTYKVYRENRVLDEGAWRFVFNGERLMLQSTRDPYISDGVFGGYIFINRIKRNTLEISRDFLFNQSRGYWNDFSNLETYTPYRKSK